MIMKRIFIVFVLILSLSGCMNEDTSLIEESEIAEDPFIDDEDLVEVIEEIDLDEALFIQGLEVYNGENLLMGLGKYEDSRIGLFNIEDRLFIKKNSEDEEIEYFGEGVSIGPDKNIYQLTWRENTLLIRDYETFEIIGEKSYETEGWGLAYDNDKDKDIFYMTDGSNTIYIRDSETFEIIDSFEVEYEFLNELEYANGLLYRNVWFEDIILEIDLVKREVRHVYDLSGIAENENTEDINNTLNGIAHIEDDVFYISGKNWNKIYKVDL